MATYTDNYALVKPTYGELADVAVINGNMDTIDGIMHSNRTMLAPAFSQTEDYAEGDVVVYEGNLYRFIVPHTAGNWDGTEVEQTTLGEEVATKGGADVTKTASGNPIEISDGADAPLVKCDVTIAPQQDLHGYTKPWVGGAGKNKLEVTTETKTADGVTFVSDSATGIVVANGLSGHQGWASITFNCTLSAGSYIINGSPTGGGYNSWIIAIYNGDTLVCYDTGNGASFTLDADATIKVQPFVYPGAGTVSNLTFKPMIRLSTESDSTFAPYSNICPISGYSSVGVNVSNGGVDVYDSEGTDGNNSNSLIEIISKDSFRVYNTRNQTYASSKQNISVYNLVVGKTYTIEADVTISSGVAALSIRNSTNSVLVYTGTITQNGHYKLTFVATLEMAKLSFFSTFDTSTTGDVTYSNIRLYEGSELNEYTISLGGTYYSGQIDAVRGVLVADKASKIFNGSEDWLTNGDRGVFITLASLGGDIKPFGDLIFSDYEVIAPGDAPTTPGKANFNRVGTALQIRDPNGMTDTTYKTYLATHNVQIVYELATPIEIPLTPTVISSLLGHNTMWTDGDNLEVEYITEDYQPLVDLIESGNGHTYSTSEQIVGKWIDGKDVYEKTIYYATLSCDRSDWAQLEALDAETFISYSATAHMETSSGRQIDNNYIRISYYNGYLYHHEPEFGTGMVDLYVTVRYTKPSSNTRSLNLTKSAVTEEIPDEIKNAPFEEKPETNEADDDAPTEVER